MPKGIKGFQKGHKDFVPKIGRKKQGNKIRGISPSKETKIKIGLANSISLKGKPQPWNSGEKSNFWKGGITPINQKIRMSLEYKLWRIAVFERDDYTCIWCGAKNGNGKNIILNADHIKPFAYFPELRFAIDNGRTLCLECHKTTDTYGK